MYIEDILNYGQDNQSDPADEQQRLITEIEEVGATVPGEPDCKLLIQWKLLKDDGTLVPWMLSISRQARHIYD